MLLTDCKRVWSRDSLFLWVMTNAWQPLAVVLPHYIFTLGSREEFPWDIQWLCSDHTSWFVQVSPNLWLHVQVSQIFDISVLLFTTCSNNFQVHCILPCASRDNFYYYENRWFTGVFVIYRHFSWFIIFRNIRLLQNASRRVILPSGGVSLILVYWVLFFKPDRLNHNSRKGHPYNQYTALWLTIKWWPVCHIYHMHSMCVCDRETELSVWIPVTKAEFNE